MDKQNQLVKSLEEIGCVCNKCATVNNHIRLEYDRNGLDFTVILPHTPNSRAGVARMADAVGRGLQSG